MYAETRLLADNGRIAVVEINHPRHAIMRMTPHGTQVELYLKSQVEVRELQEALAKALVMLDPFAPIREVAERCADPAQGAAAANVVPASPSSSGAEPPTDATVGTGTAGAIWFCAGENCGGLPYKASELTHPASCAGPVQRPAYVCRIDSVLQPGCCDWGRA